VVSAAPGFENQRSSVYSDQTTNLAGACSSAHCGLHGCANLRVRPARRYWRAGRLAAAQLIRPVPVGFLGSQRDSAFLPSPGLSMFDSSRSVFEDAVKSPEGPGPQGIHPPGKKKGPPKNVEGALKQVRRAARSRCDLEVDQRSSSKTCASGRGRPRWVRG